MIVKAGRQEIQITNPRVARMIAWLIKRQSGIQQIDKGRLQFNFAGEASVKGELTEVFDDV
jgi:hypothetical protein